jgi:DNA invertase Pin-like site-specific DNA recombinase
LAYYRVSTSEQANTTSFDDEGFSIQAQRDYCHRKATGLRATIVDEYIDRGKSARTADRAELQRLLKRVKEDSDIRYVIVHKVDRLARSREDDVQIGLLLVKYGVKLVSATENIDETPSGKLVHGIMATIAEFYSGNLGEEAKKGMRKKVEMGGTPGKAPLGYVNQRLKIPGKDIGIIAVDPTAGPIITHCFRAYATGLYTISQLTDEANDLGLRLRATKSMPERPLHPQQIHRILHNRYYIGVITFGGVEYSGDHEPLIDEPAFDTVLGILHARNMAKDKSQARPHQLKGTLHCARCGRRFGITVPTNRFGTTYEYFYCLGRQKDKNRCPQGYVPVAEVEQAVAEYWRTIQLRQERIQARSRTSSWPTRPAVKLKERRKWRASASGLAGLTMSAPRPRTLTTTTLSRWMSSSSNRNASGGRFKTAQEAISRWTVEVEALRRALDEALSLLTDPYRLYTEAPAGINLMLIQAVCEKIWILDTGVVGLELTTSYAELLTVEARLALEENQATETASDGPDGREGVGCTTVAREV